MGGEINYIQLQELYPDEYVAVRGQEVVAHAPTFDELWTALTEASIDKGTVQIEWVGSPDAVSVY